MKMVHFMVRKEGRQEPEWSSDYSLSLIHISRTAMAADNTSGHDIFIAFKAEADCIFFHPVKGNLGKSFGIHQICLLYTSGHFSKWKAK